jgi:microcompartment protein CcmL/EutN
MLGARRPPVLAPFDALGLLELGSIARGYRALDAMVKESPITVVEANLVEPGKYLILFGGGVAEVEMAFARGREVGGPSVIDALFLPGVHPRIWECLREEERMEREADTIGIVEASSVVATLDAGDQSIKSADVELCGLRIAPALGGKGYYVVNGAQTDVEAAVAAGVEVLRSRERYVSAEVIPRAHAEFLDHLLRRAPFGAP